MTDYNFIANNWAKVVEHLKTPYFIKQFEKAIKLAVDCDISEYKYETPYAHFTSSDAGRNYYDQKNREYIGTLIEQKKLSADWASHESIIEYMKTRKPQLINNDFAIEHYTTMRSWEIIADAPHIKSWRDDINAYKLAGLGTYVNPLVAHELAKTMFPKEQWIIEYIFMFTSKENPFKCAHAFVRNEKQTMYFDFASIGTDEDIYKRIINSQGDQQCHVLRILRSNDKMTQFHSIYNTFVDKLFRQKWYFTIIDDNKIMERNCNFEKCKDCLNKFDPNICNIVEELQ